jgi:hypothetical protein
MVTTLLDHETTIVSPRAETSRPLSLTDAQLDTITNAAEPLQPGSRVAIPQKRRRRIGQAPGDRRRRSASSRTERIRGMPAPLRCALTCFANRRYRRI